MSQKGESMTARLWAADPAAAAAAIQQHFPAAVQTTIQRANEICRHRFLFTDHWEMEQTAVPVQLGECIDWTAVPAGDVEWNYALNRHTIYVTLAKAWLYTQDRQYLDTFTGLIHDWIDRVPHTPESEANTWRSLEVGIRCENWLRATELFGDALQGALLREIRESLLQHGEYLVTAYGPFHRLSNWGVIQDHGLFLLGVWLERADWRELALQRMTANLHRSVLPDGVHWEQSPMYHCEVLHVAADTLLVARQNHIPVPDELESKVHQMVQALSHMVTPDRYILPQSDSDRIDAGDLLVQGALLFEEPILADMPLYEESLWDFGPEVLHRIPGLRQEILQPSASLASSGNYVLRGKETYIHMHTGTLGGGHGNADLLHLDVWHEGETVLTDSGRYTYTESPMRRALKAPAAHNTIRLDHRDYTEYEGTFSWNRIAQPLQAEHCYTSSVDTICGGHLGYLDTGAIVQRRVIYLRPDILLGLDLIRTADDRGHSAEQFFHYGEGTLTLEDHGAYWKGQHTQAQLIWLGDQRGETAEAPFSPTYNTLTTRPMLRLACDIHGTTVLPFVLSLGGACKAELCTVTTAYGQELPPETAIAIRILRNDREYTVIYVLETGFHDAALLCANGHDGRGSVLAFTPEASDGVCLKA